MIDFYNALKGLNEKLPGKTEILLRPPDSKALLAYVRVSTFYRGEFHHHEFAWLSNTPNRIVNADFVYAGECIAKLINVRNKEKR